MSFFSSSPSFMVYSVDISAFTIILVCTDLLFNGNKLLFVAFEIELNFLAPTCEETAYIHEFNLYYPKITKDLHIEYGVIYK